jgi:hypothetical protein
VLACHSAPDCIRVWPRYTNAFRGRRRVLIREVLVFDGKSGRPDSSNSHPLMSGFLTKKTFFALLLFLGGKMLAPFSAVQVPVFRAGGGLSHEKRVAGQASRLLGQR